MADGVRIIEGDCLAVLPTLPDGCVDAVVTDPPYPCIKRKYGYWTEAEWFALINPVVEQCRRVLKPTGSAMFVLQPNSERVGRMRTWLWRFMLEWGDRWGMVQDAYWWNNVAIPNGAATSGGLRASVKPCVWLGDGDCYRNQDAVLWRESDHHVSEKAAERFCNTVQTYPSGNSMDRSRVFAAAKRRGGVTPFNLLPIPNQHSRGEAGSHGHGAGTPLALCRWWTKYICPPGGTILDPFAGSGTTGVAALLEGRKAILIEREPAYVEIIRKRIAEATPPLFRQEAATP